MKSLTEEIKRALRQKPIDDETAIVLGRRMDFSDEELANCPHDILIHNGEVRLMGWATWTHGSIGFDLSSLIFSAIQKAHPDVFVVNTAGGTHQFINFYGGHSINNKNPDGAIFEMVTGAPKLMIEVAVHNEDLFDLFIVGLGYLLSPYFRAEYVVLAKIYFRVDLLTSIRIIVLQRPNEDEIQRLRNSGRCLKREEFKGCKKWPTDRLVAEFGAPIVFDHEVKINPDFDPQGLAPLILELDLSRLFPGRNFGVIEIDLATFIRRAARIPGQWFQIQIE